MYKAMVPSRRTTKDGDKTFWTRVGVAFVNAPKPGSSQSTITVKLDALPPAGELVLFPDDDDDGSGDDADSGR
jgi:hypothetical protein